MAQRLAAILYLLTALATLNAGLASFKSVSALFSTINLRWLPSFAIIDFAVPTIFLLAGLSAVWPNRASTMSRWITASAVFILLVDLCVRHGLGWKAFSEAAGVLISAVFVTGSLAKHASAIAGTGVLLYAVALGQDLILRLQFYWAFGGSYRHLLATLSPPVLVAASLIVAFYLRSTNPSLTSG